MKRRETCAVLLAITTAFICASTANIASAATVTLGSGDEEVWIGRVPYLAGGVFYYLPAACVTVGGTSTVTYLSGGSATLDQNVTIYTVGGYDVVSFVPYDGYHPPSNRNCGYTDAWKPISYNGYYLDVDGGADDDYVDGAYASGDTFISGGTGDDILYNHSTIGSLWGEAGNDNIVSDTTGGNDHLFGGNDSDCLQDTSNTYANFDCGAGSFDYRATANTGASNCEYTIFCCGVC